VVEHHPEQTIRRQSRIEPRESNIRKFNAGPSQFTRHQPSFMSNRMGGGMMGRPMMGRGMGGGGFGSHFAMGGGGHGFRH
jgi:hypothetical protein